MPWQPSQIRLTTLQRRRSPSLEQDLIALVAEFNTGGDASMVVPAEYLEVVVVKEVKGADPLHALSQPPGGR